MTSSVDINLIKKSHPTKKCSSIMHVRFITLVMQFLLKWRLDINKRYNHNQTEIDALDTASKGQLIVHTTQKSPRQYARQGGPRPVLWFLEILLQLRMETESIVYTQTTVVEPGAPPPPAVKWGKRLCICLIRCR